MQHLQTNSSLISQSPQSPGSHRGTNFGAPSVGPSISPSYEMSQLANLLQVWIVLTIIDLTMLRVELLGSCPPDVQLKSFLLHQIGLNEHNITVLSSSLQDPPSQKPFLSSTSMSSMFLSFVRQQLRGAQDTNDAARIRQELRFMLQNL